MTEKQLWRIRLHEGDEFPEWINLRAEHVERVDDCRVIADGVEIEFAPGSVDSIERFRDVVDRWRWTWPDGKALAVSVAWHEFDTAEAKPRRELQLVDLDGDIPDDAKRSIRQWIVAGRVDAPPPCLNDAQPPALPAYLQP
jgi:hypothetical protein